MSTLNWRALHNQAMRDPRGWEVPLVMLHRAISEYVHRAEQDSGADQPFGSWRDYVLGEEVGALLDAFVGLLNGPTGRLDASSLDSWARETAARIGYDMDMKSMK